ncbi:MAG: glycoside hydrolase family 9 protein [Ruminococcus sp.]|nr:glycoside hydrolase family 9 protein [Ruminococcus sp.]
MSKHSKLKKALTAVVSTAMLASSMTVTGAGVSTASAASSHNYAEALELGLYFYDANQCGTEVDDNCLTWRGNCHTYDATASLDNSNLSGTAKSAVQSIAGGNTVDVSGGYHDAGDHVKFNTTMAFNATSLNWSYYDYPEAYKETGTEGHLFYILRETADYLMKTTYRDSSGSVVAICQTVSNDSDHSYWTAPETQTYNRPTYWLSSSASNPVICYQMVAALASTAVTFKSTDSAYAAECMDYAAAIYAFAQKYSGSECGGIGSMYGVNADPDDDKAWADLWLYLADSSKYSLPTVKPNGNNDGGYTSGDYDCWVYCWDKVWGGYASLMYRITGQSIFGNEVKFEMGNLIQNNYNQVYYPISGWGTSRYNCAWQKYALTYGEVAGDKTYIEYAKKQMDYILGDNPTGYSFLIGYGDSYPVRIHHRAANPGNGSQTSADNISCKYTLYGALVGGPTTASGDYEDHSDRYQYTEPALDYNACFMLAITGLYANYGGDTTTADSIIASASEINSSFDFGDETEIVDPTPVTTTTTPKPVVTTTTTTSKAPTVTTTTNGGTSSEDADITNNGSNVWEINVEGAEKVIITVNATANSTINGCVGYSSSSSNWNQVNWDGTIDSSGNYVYEFEIPSDLSTSTIQFQVWWPQTINSVTAKLIKSTPVATTTTTVATTTTTKPVTTTTTPDDDDVVYGDVDGDGKVTINDAVKVMTYVTNKEAYPLTDAQLNVADVYQRGDGVGNMDALAIQKLAAQLIDKLPESNM